MTLTLEITEGPQAGHAVELRHPLVIGRDASADVPLEDPQVSRRHVRVVPADRGVFIEDLGSRNGTFVNAQEVHGAAAVSAGDEVTIGVTVFQVRAPEEIARQPSAVREIPPALAVPAQRPNYVALGAEGRDDSGVPELDRLRDRRTKSMATLAPLAVITIAALAVILYIGLT